MTLAGTVMKGVVILDAGPTPRDGTRVEVHIRDEPASLKVQDLNRFLEGLPRLGDDAAAFSDAVRAIRREFPAEGNAWD